MEIRSLLLAAALSGFGNLAAGAALAQDIEVDQLDAAQAFAPGIEFDGALESRAWQGTSVERATRLLDAMPMDTSHPILLDMLRRVVLSGLVPPQEADDAFEQARIAAAQTLATPDEYATFAARNPAARDPLLRANASIASGDLAGACEISDMVQQGRGDSFWIRLRAACHDLRSETAAADLARDILRDRGETLDLVVPDAPEGFWVDVMAMDAAALDAFMTEKAGDPQPVQIGPETDDATDINTPVEESLADQVADELPKPEPLVIDPLASSPLFTAPTPVPTFDLDAALADTSDQGTAQLFLLGRDGDARAVAAFVARAEEAGLNPFYVLPRIPAVLDPTDMAQADLPLFARYAAISRDIPMMQALFIASEDEAVRNRLALASDAIGGGFYGRALGNDLENALSEDETGAHKDVLMALALGSTLSESAELRLAEIGLSSRLPIGLDHAVSRGAQAETLLRVVQRVDRAEPADGTTIYEAIQALRAVGYSEIAGQLAAYEYLRGL